MRLCSIQYCFALGLPVCAGVEVLYKQPLVMRDVGPNYVSRIQIGFISGICYPYFTIDRCQPIETRAMSFGLPISIAIYTSQ